MIRVALSCGVSGLLAAAISFTALHQQQPQAPSQDNQPASVVTPQPLRDGPTLFQQSGCAHCHGADLHGTDKGPALRSVGLTSTLAKITVQIHAGGAAMPAFGGVLTDPEIANLVDYLSLQKTPLPKSRRKAKP